MILFSNPFQSLKIHTREEVVIYLVKQQNQRDYMEVLEIFESLD